MPVESENRAHYPYKELPKKSGDKPEIPYGVSPMTYNLILDGMRYGAFDSLDEITKKLIDTYFFTEASLRDLRAVAGIRNTGTIKKRILGGLSIGWEHLPPEIQQQYPKEEAIRMKDAPRSSPALREKHARIFRTFWEDPSRRQKMIEGIRKRKDNPNFIQRMRELRQGRSPMEGKKHTQETKEKIREATQENWDKKHGIHVTDGPLARITVVVKELSTLHQNIGHEASTTEITRLRKQGKTKFSVTPYKQILGHGSFTRAKEVSEGLSEAVSFLNALNENPSTIAHRRVLEKDIKEMSAAITNGVQDILSSTSNEEIKAKIEILKIRMAASTEHLAARRNNNIEGEIGKEEKSMWEYVKKHDLLNKILKTRVITEEELEQIRNYFEKNIIGENLTMETFNNFTIAVARLPLSVTPPEEMKPSEEKIIFERKKSVPRSPPRKFAVDLP